MATRRTRLPNFAAVSASVAVDRTAPRAAAIVISCHCRLTLPMDRAGLIGCGYG